MKKRIEEDGVVYTIDATSGNCIDIDVKPGVEEVSFGASFGRAYLLGDCKKVFPDVRKIVIDYSVYDIDIPNTLFPNVKEVECSSWYGKYIKSGSLLLRNDNGQILTNRHWTRLVMWLMQNARLTTFQKRTTGFRS